MLVYFLVGGAEIRLCQPAAYPLDCRPMDHQQMFALAKELIAIDSVTGNENNLAVFLTAYLRDMGLTVELSEPVAGRPNLFAYTKGEKPELLFNTHLDTVPPQYGPTEDAHHIFGRGACDTHGILAAQIMAIKELKASEIKGIGLLLVIAEETDHLGAIHAGKHITEPKFMIVGEPTENKLVVGTKGFLRLSIEAHGVAGHSGYPEKFDSAINKLIDLLQLLRADVAQLPPHDRLGPSSLNIGSLVGGDADNKISDSAKARLMYRLSIPVEQIKQRIEKRIEAVSSHLSNSSMQHFTCTYETDAEPDLGWQPLVGFDDEVVPFCTDGPFFNWQNCKRYLIGPGSALDAHTDDEKISKESMISAVPLYISLVKKLLKSER